MNTRRVFALAAVSFAIALTTACLGDSTGVSSSPTVEETTFATSLGVDLTKSTRTTNGDYVRDIVVGTGPVVAVGDSLSVRYTGWLSNGTQFDTNTAAVLPFGFRLGANRVIPGWEEGVPGMRVGGTRQILVPPALGYGVYQYGPIPGNSVLVFTVQLIGKP
jgi:FKBP-type peptidyl-prolyl cis-trans isomerase FkpA